MTVDAQSMRIRWSTDGASTFKSTANYTSMFFAVDVGWNMTIAADGTSGYANWNGDDGLTDEPASVMIDIRHMANSSGYSYTSSFGGNQWGNDLNSYQGWSVYEVAEAHNGWRLFPSSGLFTGKWVLYGLVG